MNHQLVLPQSTLQLINKVDLSQRHPGLQLDKFSIPGEQTAQKGALENVCNTVGDPNLFKTVSDRRQSLLRSLPGYCFFKATTVSPLSLHLARASALENAGLCLHPLYGFAYLPGSGLKGMARAYAETVWLPEQPDQKQAWRQIEDIFGWAPNPDRKEQIKDPEHPAELRREDENDPESPEIKASSGNIIFHDAWPESWPKLIVDIVNNHHPAYYQADPDDNAHPPGDWENPVPVYFLAVKPGTTFTFLLAKRRADVADELLDLARQWLLGALCHLGAGAKTNSGYGAFKPADGETPALPTQRRAVFETTLELMTPAFLAGASQQAEDCDLRPATLRGLLRWWWRTMHAGFVGVKTLRSLEAAIWGDTKGGGAVRIVIEKVSGQGPQPYDKRSKANFNDQQKRSEHGIPNEDPRKTTQGLWYASYGMDETNRRRHYLDSGACWCLRLVARPTRFFMDRKNADDPKKANQGKAVTAEQALSQAKAALWLLCHFGGVGSKARKGFGSLSAKDSPENVLNLCKTSAQQLRQQLGLPNTFDERRAESPSLQQLLGPGEVTFPWPNVWSVLDQVGFAYQTFAKKYKHRREKMALGLPRRVGQPAQGSFNPTPPVTANSRHSSPVHIHVDGKPSNWTVRVIAFPAAHLPDLATSRKFLEEFLENFRGDLARRCRLTPPLSGPFGGGASSRPSVASPSSTAGPTPVRVKFLGPHDRLRNAFWVQEEGRRRGLLKYGTPPTPLPAVDSEIEVYRTNDNLQSPEYRWDKPGTPHDRTRGGQRPRGGSR